VPRHALRVRGIFCFKLFSRV